MLFFAATSLQHDSTPIIIISQSTIVNFFIKNLLKYFIDIHRDSVNKNVTSVNINGKDYARILFVIGLEHDNYKDNLKLSEDLNNLFNKYYKGLSRGIYKKEGPGVDGIYNQDISPNSILIEVGGVDNNIDEVLNTTEAISNILYYYIKGDNNG